VDLVNFEPCHHILLLQYFLFLVCFHSFLQPSQMELSNLTFLEFIFLLLLVLSPPAFWLLLLPFFSLFKAYDHSWELHVSFLGVL